MFYFQDTVNWSNILPTPAQTATSTPKQKQKSRKPVSAAPYTKKPGKVNKVSENESFKSIQQNLLDIINQYKSKDSQQTPESKRVDSSRAVNPYEPTTNDKSAVEHVKIQPLPTNTQAAMPPNPSLPIPAKGQQNLLPPISQPTGQSGHLPQSQPPKPMYSQPTALSHDQIPTTVIHGQPPVYNPQAGLLTPAGQPSSTSSSASCRSYPLQTDQHTAATSTQPQMLVVPAPVMFMADQNPTPVPIITQTQHGEYDYLIANFFH